MLRISLLIALVGLTLGQGVDDTTKRRSEEILRAVAAAATADYEGLQQMKHQKAKTYLKIQKTSKTKACIVKLQEALRREQAEIAVAEAKASRTADQIALQKRAKEEILNETLWESVVSVHKALTSRYSEVMSHAESMSNEIQNQIQKYFDNLSSDYVPNIVDEIIAPYPGGSDSWKDTGVLEGRLTKMLLAKIQEGVLDKVKNTRNDYEVDWMETDIVDIFHQLETWHENGNKSKMLDSTLDNIHDFLMDYLNQKARHAQQVTKVNAYRSAKDMTWDKHNTVNAALSKIVDFEGYLASLEDDEMRKIADIKEEFESLTTDWWHLAKYHCCDIVQANPVECADAVDAFIAPLNTAFPADDGGFVLRRPDVKTDCQPTRRLL